MYIIYIYIYISVVHCIIVINIIDITVNLFSHYFHNNSYITLYNISTDTDIIETIITITSLNIHLDKHLK